MSDGNFNRNLLPYRNYQSGVRAGQAAMRTRALNALRALLDEHPSGLSEGEKAEWLARFKEQLL